MKVRGIQLSGMKAVAHSSFCSTLCVVAHASPTLKQSAPACTLTSLTMTAARNSTFLVGKDAILVVDTGVDAKAKEVSCCSHSRRF